MVRTLTSRILSWTVLVSLAVALTAAQQSALGADAPLRRSKRLIRMPAHYASVVTQEQKEKILKIQEEYQPKIEALEKERDAKIEAILTPEQKQKIDEVSGKAKKEAAAKALLKESETPATPAEKPAK